MGSGKEMLGNAIGAEGLKKEGIKQNQEGKGYVSLFSTHGNMSFEDAWVADYRLTFI